MQYWILQHNPKLLHGGFPHKAGPASMDYWQISRCEDEVRAGDVAFIWYAGANRGIYDVAELCSVPPHEQDASATLELLKNSDSCSWTDVQERDRLRQLPSLLIRRQYPDLLSPPVCVDELRNNGFGQLPVIRMPQRGIYVVAPLLGERLLAYIRKTRQAET